MIDLITFSPFFELFLVLFITVFRSPRFCQVFPLIQKCLQASSSYNTVLDCSAPSVPAVLHTRVQVLYILYSPLAKTHTFKPPSSIACQHIIPPPPHPIKRKSEKQLKRRGTKVSSLISLFQNQLLFLFVKKGFC